MKPRRVDLPRLTDAQLVELLREAHVEAVKRGKPQGDSKSWHWRVRSQEANRFLG